MLIFYGLNQLQQDFYLFIYFFGNEPRGSLFTFMYLNESCKLMTLEIYICIVALTISLEKFDQYQVISYSHMLLNATLMDD